MPSPSHQKVLAVPLLGRSHAGEGPETMYEGKSAEFIGNGTETILPFLGNRHEICKQMGGGEGSAFVKVYERRRVINMHDCVLGHD